MITFLVIAISCSVLSVIFSSLLTIYTFRTANLKKPHVRLILFSQLSNITLQTGQFAALLYSLPDPSNLQYRTILSALQAFVSSGNIFVTGLLSVQILSIFAIYDYRLTAKIISRLKRIWYVSTVIFMVPADIYFTYLAVTVVNNEGRDYILYTVIIVGMAWFFVIIATILGNMMAAYILSLVLRKTDAIQVQHKPLVKKLVSLNALAICLAWVAHGVYAYVFATYENDDYLIISANIFSNSIAGIHASIVIVVFYGLQEIALSKALKRRQAEKDRKHLIIEKPASPVVSVTFGDMPTVKATAN